MQIVVFLIFSSILPVITSGLAAFIKICKHTRIAKCWSSYLGHLHFLLHLIQRASVLLLLRRHGILVLRL